MDINCVGKKKKFCDVCLDTRNSIFTRCVQSIEICTMSSLQGRIRNRKYWFSFVCDFAGFVKLSWINVFVEGTNVDRGTLIFEQVYLSFSLRKRRSFIKAFLAVLTNDSIFILPNMFSVQINFEYLEKKRERGTCAA